MLDFNNLNYFPSLFEDLSKPNDTYVIVKDIGSHAINNTFRDSTGTNPDDLRSLTKVPSLLEDKSSLSTPATLDIPHQATPIIDTFSQKTYSVSPKSLSYDSASSTFSKYYYYADTTVPSVKEASTTPLKTLSSQIEFSDGILVESTPKKKLWLLQGSKIALT